MEIINKPLKVALYAFTVSCILANVSNGQESALATANRNFTEVGKEFSIKDKNLRKWDAPVVVDLDNDGYLDLLINDHGYGVQVCWNNKGKFEKPYDILIGDVHGASVGDLDGDGNLEIIMARGGGSGSNARNSKLFTVNKKREFTELPDFNVPLEMMRGRTVKFVDLDNDGDLDLLNFAFPDADKKGESENYIYENIGKGELVLKSKLPAIKADGQKTLVTDFNGDAIVDIIMYGNGSVKAFQGLGDFTFKEVTDKIFPFKIDDVTSINEIDFDNDGDFDLFFTRSKDFEIGETFFDKESKTWGFFTKRGAFKFADLEVGDVLNMENFQSQWPNADTYFIGESGYDYKFPAETHSGKNIRLVNSNSLGFPDNYKDKSGFYIGYVGNDKWRIAGSLNAPATGVVHGVLDYPDYNHPKAPSTLLLENKGGKFTDVTEKSKIFLNEFIEGATVADFDNNGFADILMVKRGDLIHPNKSVLYLNSGNALFEPMQDLAIVSNELGAIGMAVETIDYNLDGKIDAVLGNERGKWHLFKNELANAIKNKSVTIEIGNSKSGKATALGAVVELQSCNKKQIQRVASTGASYSLSFNKFVHFGLDSCDKAIKVKVTWSNGETTEQMINSINTKIIIGTKN